MLRTSAPLIGALGLMVMAKSKLIRHQKRLFCPHNAYLRIARIELEKAETKEPGWFNSAFVTITFSALAIEAICNAIGYLVDPDWNLHDKESPLGKLQYLTKLQAVPLNWKAEPWRTVRWLCKLRNDLAHPRPEDISVIKVSIPGPGTKEHTSAPDSTLEKEITVGKAKRSFQAVEQLKDILAKTVPVEQRLGLYSDGWTTSTKIEHEP